MDLNQDAELLEIFHAEMADRVPRLIEAAEAMGAGTLTDELVTTAAREAHTIKGTARVMGHDVIADAGAELERLWKEVAEREAEPTKDLAAKMMTLSQQLLPALDTPAAEGTPEPSAAIDEVPDAAPVSDPPQIDAPIDPSGSGDRPELRLIEGGMAEAEENRRPGDNLGGLLASDSAIAGGETTAVDTSKLYQLINRVAELRLDTEALSGTIAALRMAASSAPNEVVGLATRWESAVSKAIGSVTELQGQAVGLVAVPLQTFTDTLPGLVRFLARKTGKEVRLEIVGDDVDVDQQVLTRIADVIRNVVVNAIEHGLEVPEERTAAGKTLTGTLNLTASVEEGQLSVVVSDDGRGIDWAAIKEAARQAGKIGQSEEPSTGELTRMLFEVGISTSATHSELSGSGQGFPMVGELVSGINGSVNVDSSGAGTRVRVTVPAFQSLQRALIVKAGGRDWGIPEAAVLDRFNLLDAETTDIAGSTEINWRDGLLPLTALATAAGMSTGEHQSDVVIVSTNIGPRAFSVEEILGVREVASRGLGPLVAGNPFVTGAALLGGGDLAVMIDPSALGDGLEARDDSERQPIIMVVDDSPGVQQLVAGALAAGGFEPLVAGSTDEALAVLGEAEIDALVVDFSMPGSDGVTLAEAVRARFGSDLPIVMVSAVASRADQERARNAGINVYFDKSDFREGALISALHSLVGTADRRGRKAK